MSRTKQNENANPYKPNFWYVLNNVWIRSIDKGQTIIFGVLLALTILVSRIPREHTYDSFQSLLEIFGKTQYLGWILFVLICIVYYGTVKFLVYYYKAEIERISKVKSEMQKEKNPNFGNTNKN